MWFDEFRGVAAKPLRACLGVLAMFSCTAAHADLIAVVGAASPAGKISPEQLQAVFTMRLRTLPGAGNAQLIMVGSTRTQVLAALGKSEEQMKSIWVRQVFTGGGTPPLELADATEAKKALKNPNAIAVIDSSQVDASVKVIGQF